IIPSPLHSAPLLRAHASFPTRRSSDLYTGEEMTIGFNSRYILDALAPIEDEAVVFEFKDALSPGVIKSGENDGYCCVIMPMRIRSEEHTSELQSRFDLVCRLLLEKKKH